MGGGGSTNTTSNTQSAQVTELPPWINRAAQQNYALAQNIATEPLQQFQGQQIAGVAPQQKQAWNLAANSGQAGADQYNAAQAGYLNAMGAGPLMGNAAQLGSTNLSPYMNPYTSSVINATLPIMQQQLGLQQAGNQSQAAGAGAYGGSRQGIQQGVTQAQGALNMAQMAAQLNQQNFQQAQQGALSDVAARNQMTAANQSAWQNAVNSQINAAAGLGGLGNQAQQNQRQQFLELSTAGAQEQQQQQNEINAQMAQFQQANMYPYQQLGVLQSALGMTPYGSATLGSSSSQQQQQIEPSLSQTIFGGLQSLGSAFGQGGPLAPLLSSLLPGSDRHLKTDIQHVGVHKPTGLPIYSYRYKGDPKNYPKVIGPMAEDAMKVNPGAVHTVGVHPSGQPLHAVDMAALAATPALRPGGARGASNAGVPGMMTPTRPSGLSGAMRGQMKLGALGG